MKLTWPKTAPPSAETITKATVAKRNALVSFIVIFKNPTIIPSSINKDVKVLLAAAGETKPVITAIKEPKIKDKLPKELFDNFFTNNASFYQIYSFCNI